MKWSDCKANRKPKGIFFIHNLFLRYFLPTVLNAEALPTQRGFVGIHLQAWGGLKAHLCLVSLRKTKLHLWDQIQSWCWCFCIVAGRCFRTVVLVTSF